MNNEIKMPPVIQIYCLPLSLFSYFNICLFASAAVEKYLLWQKEQEYSKKILKSQDVMSIKFKYKWK